MQDSKKRIWKDRAWVKSREIWQNTTWFDLFKSNPFQMFCNVFVYKFLISFQEFYSDSLRWSSRVHFNINSDKLFPITSSTPRSFSDSSKNFSVNHRKIVLELKNSEKIQSKFVLEVQNGGKTVNYNFVSLNVKCFEITNDFF